MEVADFLVAFNEIVFMAVARLGRAKTNVVGTDAAFRVGASDATDGFARGALVPIAYAGLVNRAGLHVARFARVVVGAAFGQAVFAVEVRAHHFAERSTDVEALIRREDAGSVWALYQTRRGTSIAQGCIVFAVSIRASNEAVVFASSGANRKIDCTCTVQAGEQVLGGAVGVVWVQVPASLKVCCA